MASDLTTASRGCRGGSRLAAALLFRQTVRVPGRELKFELVSGLPRRRDRILRDDAAIPFHFHVEIIARQDRAAEIQDVGKTPGFEAMIEILGDVSLQHARFAFPEGAAAIDKLLRDVSNFGDVKVRGYPLAIRQNKAGKRCGMRAEGRFEFVQFHGQIYIPEKECS